MNTLVLSVLAAILCYIAIGINDSSILVAAMLLSPMMKTLLDANGVFGLLKHAMVFISVWTVGFVGAFLESRVRHTPTPSQRISELMNKIGVWPSSAVPEMMNKYGNWRQKWRMYLTMVAIAFIFVATGDVPPEAAVGLSILASLLPPAVASGFWAGMHATSPPDGPPEYMRNSTSSFALYAVNAMAIMVAAVAQRKNLLRFK